jgi:uncharacterized iron-regulated membrane protein
LVIYKGNAQPRHLVLAHLVGNQLANVAFDSSIVIIANSSWALWRDRTGGQEYDGQ